MTLFSLSHYFSRPERVKRRIEEINDDILRLRKQQLAYAVEVEKTAAVDMPTLPDN